MAINYLCITPGSGADRRCTLRIKVACKTSHESVQVALVQGRPLELWLTNFEASVTADVGPMELFGFNVGSFQEKPTGRLRL